MQKNDKVMGVRCSGLLWKDFKLWCIEHDTDTGKEIRRLIRERIQAP